MQTKQPKIIRIKGISPDPNGQKASIIKAAQFKIAQSQNLQPVQKSATKTGKIGSMIKHNNDQQSHSTLTLDDRLHNEIKVHQIAKGQLKNYKVNEYQDENQVQSNDLFNSIQDKEPPEFYRSQRSVAMRIKDTNENQLHVLETDKLALIQKLNDALVQLDKLNQEKTAISNKVIDMTKFVRDMQRETQKSDDMNGVVNGGLRSEYLFEKKLNVQMKEGMKRVEAEKIKVVQRTKELEIEAAQLQSDGIEMAEEFNHKQALVIDLERDYEDAVTQIRSAQGELDNIRLQIHDTDEQILTFRNRIQAIDDERLKCIDEVLNRQIKFDNVRANMSNQRQQMDLSQDNEIRMRSCIQLIGTLNLIMKYNKLAHFNQIKDTSAKINKNIAGLLKMRKTVKQNRSKTLKRYIIRWYKNVLKPLQNRKQKLQITDVLAKNNPTMYYYYIWRKNFIVSRHNKVKIHQALLKMLNSKNNYHARVMKYGFIRWKDQIVSKLDNKKLVLGKIFNKHRNRMSQYFSRWQQLSLELDHQIQLTAMAQRFTANKYLCVLFSSWRAIVQTLKVKRLSRLNLLREHKLRQNNLMKSIFDVVRQNKEEEKLLKTVQILNEIEIPRKKAAQETIEQVQHIYNEKQVIYAVRIIVKNLNKGVFSYYETWKKQCDTYKVTLNNKIKLRLINSCNSKLRNAFTKMIAYKGHAMLKQQQAIYQTYQEEISDQNNLIIENQNLLKDKQQKQKTQSGKQMKKIMTGAFQRQLKEKFNLWRRNQEFKLYKQDKTQSLINIMGKQLKRLAFKKYLQKIMDINTDNQNTYKITQFQQKATLKLLLRSFLAVVEFSRNHQSAKNGLKRVIRNLDQNVKHNTFKKWHQYRHECQQEALSNSQTTTVESIKALIDETGNLQDHVEILNQQNKRTGHTLQQQAKRVIQNSFLRCHELSQRHYFVQWKQHVEKQKRLELVFKKAIVHWQRKGQDYTLKLWLKWQAQKKQIILEMAIQDEEQLALNVSSTTFQAQTRFKNERDQCGIDLNKLSREQNEFSSKHSNCISALVIRRDTNFYQPKLQYILSQWREYTSSRKKSFLLFEKCLTKSLWQAAFSEIKHVARQNTKASKKNSGSKRVASIIYKLKTKSALKKWQSSIHQIVMINYSKAEKEKQRANHQFNLARDILQLKLVDNQFKDSQFNILFECFQEFRTYCSWQKAKRIKTQQFNLNLKLRQQKVTIQKWQKRRQATLRLKQKCFKLSRKLYGLNTRAIFNEWREVFQKEKRLCECIRNMVKKAEHIDLKNTLDLLKRRFFQNQSHVIRSKNFSINALQRLLQSQKQKLLLQAFKKYQHKTQQINNTKINKRSILIKYFTERARSYLKLWQQQAQKQAVIQYNFEEGPIKIETHKLNKQLQILKQALRDEGHQDFEINNVLKEGKDKNTMLIEKAVSRMYCFNNDLYLLPWCLDEWKRWLRQRKDHRKAIQLLVNRCDYNKAEMDHAFRKWKNQRIILIRNLQGMQKIELERQCIENSQHLEKAACQLEAQTYNSEELKDQRDVLLKTFVNSQKLALAVINGGQERAKQRALSRLLSVHHNTTKGEYQQVLTFNLDKINELKSRIKQLEMSNNSIAYQNEELREGALDGIDMAHNIEELSQEREKLSIDLADKAITIRKLLEDNNNLSIRLVNAQEEAQKLIRISQHNMNINRSHLTPNKYYN